MCYLFFLYFCFAIENGYVPGFIGPRHLAMKIF